MAVQLELNSHNDGSEILATQNRTKKIIEKIFDLFLNFSKFKKVRFFFEFFKNFSFVSFFRTFFPEIGRAETIRLVQKSSNFELSSRFFGRLKIFIGQGSLYSLEPIFQTPHYC